MSDLESKTTMNGHKPHKKMAILTLTPESIRELLQLPDGAVLIGMQIPFMTPGVLELKVEGAGWDTIEGQMIRVAEGAEIMRMDDGSISVDWKLPE